MQAYTRSLDLFAEVLKCLNLQYVDTIDNLQLTDAALATVMGKLDPYTQYYTPEEAKAFEEDVSGEYAGVGCVTSQRDSVVVIAEVLEGTPAHELGICAGDKIIAIDSVCVKGWSVNDISGRMRGTPDTRFTMTLQHYGADTTYVVEVTRRIIQQRAIPYYGVVNDSVGYIVLEQFSRNSAQEFRQAFIDLKENHNITSLVINLCDNGGGLIDEAVDMLSIFLPHSTKVLELRNLANDEKRVQYTVKEPLDTEIPVVVLINGMSASASEIFSGSLQDLDRAVIVGNRSVGKGLVQSTLPLPYGRMMKYTTSYYYIPSGRSVQAIDYFNAHNENGVYRVPDSLSNEFVTAAGRKVYDGGGIKPDVEVKEDSVSSLLYYLYTDYVLSDFAVEYINSHGKITDLHNFVFTDEDYESFKSYVKESGFVYDKVSSKQLEHLRQWMEYEGYINEQTTQQLDALTRLLAHNIDYDLDFFRVSIQRQLVEMIAITSSYKRGGIIVDMRNNPYLQAALEILQEEGRYRTILSPVTQ